MRVLLVEDDPTLLAQLADGVRSAGYAVDLACNGVDAHFMGDTEPYDAVVLDLGLPQLDGLSVLRKWRSASRNMPVLILTARDGWHEKVAGIDAGADDYLTKPFAIQELEARLRALIRRERRQVGAEVLKVADLVLDPVSMRATRGGTELMLSPIGLRLLTILMRESPRVVTRRDIEREIWGDGLPDSDTLRSHLYNLRKAIDRPFDRPLLHTVQTAGYRIADLDAPPAA